MTKVEKAEAEAAKRAFSVQTTMLGSHPTSEEVTILSAERERLPQCAAAILEGKEATAEYWDWLSEKFSEAVEKTCYCRQIRFLRAEAVASGETAQVAHCDRLIAECPSATTHDAST